MGCHLSLLHHLGVFSPNLSSIGIISFSPLFHFLAYFVIHCGYIFIYNFLDLSQLQYKTLLTAELLVLHKFTVYFTVSNQLPDLNITHTQSYMFTNSDKHFFSWLQPFLQLHRFNLRLALAFWTIWGSWYEKFILTKLKTVDIWRYFLGIRSLFGKYDNLKYKT